jgi:hypothetical protein
LELLHQRLQPYVVRPRRLPRNHFSPFTKGPDGVACIAEGLVSIAKNYRNRKRLGTQLFEVIRFLNPFSFRTLFAVDACQKGSSALEITFGERLVKRLALQESSSCVVFDIP